MELDDYDRKMKQLVDDENTYEKLNRDPTGSIESKNNQFVKRLMDLKLIDAQQAYRLKSNTAICPRIYGLPKAHKPELPLRPVVPNITSPTYQLSKYVSNIIQAATNCEYNIRDSFTFAAEIKHLKVPEDHVIVSFDVISLFTNVPKELILRAIREDWDRIKEHTQINMYLFLEIVNFCLDNSYFMFRSQIYSQKFGTAMGSPLSPILADIVLNKLITTVVQSLDFVILFLKKYVDDFFIVLPRDKVQATLEAFNNYNERLQFTVEEENNGRLPFLDILVIRNDDQTLSTEWYSKPISSGRLLNYHSFHPIQQKVNVVANFIKRVIGLTSTPNVDQIKRVVHAQLRRNNYPPSLINRLLYRSFGSNSLTRVEPEIEDHIGIDCYVALPYIPQLSESIAKCLKKDYPRIKIANQNAKTAKIVYTKVKDPVESMLQHNVIYNIPCQNCDRCYIGMTSNKLKTRLSGHKSNINKLNRLLEQGYTNNDEAVVNINHRSFACSISSSNARMPPHPEHTINSQLQDRHRRNKCNIHRFTPNDSNKIQKQNQNKHPTTLNVNPSNSPDQPTTIHYKPTIPEPTNTTHE
ncbi:uncharacterized protein LOC134286653 [Aedes albopictus]|uniref:Reverse transcriptase domain-containing protein n=1 Tax=Aedes albopictus TaxID=7160 RepID=A0ABM1YLX3_AEDAL